MGYGVPGGIGASLVAGGRPVFTFVGDGGFMTGHGDGCPREASLKSSSVTTRRGAR